MTWSAKVLLALLLIVPSTAAAQDTTTTEPDPVATPSVMSFDYFAPRYRDAKAAWHRIRQNRCRWHGLPHRWPSASEVNPTYRDERLAKVRAKRDYARTLASRCLPSTPAGIIRYVFPSATEDAAVRVAYCESRLSPTAYNSSSGAAGLFQFMPFWYAGKWNPFDPWVNTRKAYDLSSAGTNWGPWVCKP